MVNKVILVGRLGKDPEMRYSEAGVASTYMSVATERSWTEEGGETRKETEWHNVITWRALAEACNEHLKKGCKVYIEGRLHSREAEHEGFKYKKVEVVAQEVKFL